jgi:hypothetical protein
MTASTAPQAGGYAHAIRGRIPGCQRFRHQQFDHIAVFGVQHGQQAVFAAPARITRKDIAVLQAQAVVIGRKYLQRGDAFSHQCGNLSQHLFIQMGDVHVKTEIDGGFGVCFCMPGVDIGFEPGRSCGTKSITVVVPPKAAALCPV